MHTQLSRAQYRALAHALRQARWNCAADVVAAEYSDSPSWAMGEAAARGSRAIWEARQQLPVPRDPLGFAVMHENWRIRRSHVLARVRARRAEALKAERAAMVREPGESLMDFVSRKCGLVRDEQYCHEART
ncbi:hypothetical protein LQ772_06635 [Frateuria edaphi]|uniref:hypothetical protein n=1 Tax=Frateuria edaphi TaxID=2898793 RepID=UPI001E3DBD64|nr:hypothetical protein [Frateuria edaphi]UGB46962.1 hypothetical protein LQ772_06635 [Frateuria edaphi]